jgi:hypothetical protein
MIGNHIIPEEHRPLRKVVLLSEWGSQYMNLSVPESDRDIFGFTLPSYHDNSVDFHYTKFSNSNNLDYSFRDIRLLDQLLYEANFVDMLYANLTYDEVLYPEIHELVHMRNALARMDLSQLYHNLILKAIEDFKNLRIGKSDVIKQWGYSPKVAMQCYRALDTIERFLEVGFEDLSLATKYADNDPQRVVLMAIRTGSFTHEEILSMLQYKLHAILVTEHYKYNVYLNSPKNLDTINRMRNLIRSLWLRCKS